MSTRRQYLLNVFWSWVSALALILSGLVIAPYLIRRLGAERYGVWALAWSFVEYFWLIDLGVRPAVVKLAAEYRALDNWDALNRLINTAVAYSAVMGALILTVVSGNAAAVARFFRITDPSFPFLIQVVSASWAFGIVANVFAAALEGSQRFEITNRIVVIFIVIRGALLVLLVSLGYGLVEMGVALLATQMLMYAGFWVTFHREYPRVRFAAASVTRAQGAEIWRYARQLVSGVISLRLLQSALPSIIARGLPVENVTYFTVTQKVLDYGTEGSGRLGMITSPRASDWMARGYTDSLIRLARYGNRYSLCLWLAFATFLLVYAGPLFRIWISGEFAAHASILIPPLLCGYTLWMGQSISASILMGIGRFSAYSNSLLIEALVIIAGFAVVLPLWGLTAGAVVIAICMIANRCVNLAVIFCREFHLSTPSFLRTIYVVPLALALADVLLFWMVRTFWIPGRSWAELLAAGAMNTVVFGTGVLWLVAEPAHRQFAFELARRPWRSRARTDVQAGGGL
jgi:O-antigen/teichoic acid export membrane protein